VKKSKSNHLKHLKEMAVNIEIAKNLAVHNEKMEVFQIQDGSIDLLSKVRKKRNFSLRKNIIM